MNRDGWEMIAIAVATLAQVYATEPNSFRLAIAKFWNEIAWLLGMLANALAHWSMIARLNYYEVINNVV